MENDNKKNVIEQASQHLSEVFGQPFDLDDTMPVEVVEDEPQPLNHNVVVLNALGSMYAQAQSAYRLTGNSLILDYLKQLAHDLGYTDSEEIA